MNSDCHLLNDDTDAPAETLTAHLLTREQIEESVRLLREIVGPRMDVRTARCHVGITEAAHCTHCKPRLAAWKLLEEIGA